MLGTEYCLVQGICGKAGLLPVGAPLLFAWGHHPDLSGSLSCRRYSHDFVLIVNEITFLSPRWCPLVMPEQKKTLMQEHLQPGVHTEILWQKGEKKAFNSF